MMTTNPSYIDAEAVAKSLFGLDPSATYGHSGDSDVSLDLPDGRRVALRLVRDDSPGIGRWLGEEHGHDDVFGIFSWRKVDRDTGGPESRPSEFDGSARAFDPRGYQCPNLGDRVWWQPPAEVVAMGPEAVESLARTVDSWIRGDWGQVGFLVTITEDGEEVGSDSIWGVEWDYPESPNGNAGHVSILADCLSEAGIGKSSSIGVARWARDSIEAIARRLSDEDPDDAGPNDAYHATMRELLAWWKEEVEAVGDWDTYADPMTARMESDFEAFRLKTNGSN